ncbi:hypothetical protein BH23ACT11_BH23ACT11_02700 [soil metagenome]
MAKEEVRVATVDEQAIAPGLIVRHTNRRLGKLDSREACKRLISGRISFSEFVDQAGEKFRDLLEFMSDHDLHPGRPEDVVHCIERDARAADRRRLRRQLTELYSLRRQPESAQ